MNRTYQQIRRACVAKGYKWFDGRVNINYVWERTSDVFTNKFTDLLHICYTDASSVNQIITIPVTTKPGLRGSVLSPRTVDGVKGTAVIMPGQYHNAWQFHDTDKEFSNYPYFRQVGNINYWRDGDGDTELDKVNEQDNKLFETHWHRMSQNGTYGSGLVNEWSLGCMGAAEPEWKKILPIVREFVIMCGDLVTGTVIESGDVG